MKKKLHMIVMTLILSMLLAGCGAPDTAQTTSYVPQTVVENTPKSETDVKKEKPAKEETEIADETAEPEAGEKVEETDGEIGTEGEIEAGEAIVLEVEEEAKEEEVQISTTSAPKFGSLEDIAAAASTKAACETYKGRKESYIDTKSEVNPYDVIYNYGEAFDAYVDACDWSLVFDADYYMSTFPMLALQYHYDEELLLMHFQTVGIHEGRQGSEDFNVGAYMSNCKSKISKAFEDNYAAYYIYYMLSYRIEKKVDTVNAKDGSSVEQQYTMVLTWYQQNELKDVNRYRENAGSDPVKFDSELAAFAAYRGYLNANDGWKAHDWLLDANNYDNVIAIINKMASTGFHLQENNCEWFARTARYSKFCAESYYNSMDHREAMNNPNNVCIGISGVVVNSETNDQSEFDIYLDSHINTVMHH